MRLPALVRTTTFKLSIVYIALILVYSVLLLGHIYLTTVAHIRDETEQLVNGELDSILSAYDTGGLARVNQSLLERASTPDRFFLYQLETQSGIKLSGDLSAMPRDGTGPVDFEFYAHQPGGGEVVIQARGRIVNLGPEARLMVAFDSADSSQIIRSISEVVWRGAGVGLVLALIGGVIVSRWVAQRTEQLVTTAEAVMGGDLDRRADQKGRDDEFDRLAERMNAMLDRLQALVHDSRHAGDAIAHDLRSPLSRMRNRLEKALRQPLSACETREVLENTIEEADRLLTTFNAILSLSRMTAHAEMRLVRTDISEVLSEVSELFEPAALDAGLDFKADPGRPVHVMADREMIAQALSNLIDNAIKYTPSGGAIHVSLRRAGDNMVDLIVKDTGIGIDEAERERVKQRFVRMDKARTLPGAGLGLALVDAVARIHRGELILLHGDGPPERPGLKAVLRLRRA